MGVLEGTFGLARLSVCWVVLPFLLANVVMPVCCDWDTWACARETGKSKCTAKAASPQPGVVLMLLSWPREMWKVVNAPLTSVGLPFKGLALTCMVEALMTLKFTSILALIGWGSPG